jgi:hypothetical protein
MENDNFNLFAADGKRWWQTSVCLFAAKGKGKRKFVFLGRQTINGSRLWLFQQRCSFKLTGYLPAEQQAAG